MSDVRRLSGISLRLPSGIALADATREAEGSRGFDFTKPIVLEEEHDPMWGELRSALSAADLELVDTLDLVPDADLEGLRATGASPSFDVPVADDEEAVVLLDEDGVLTWVFPTEEITGTTDDVVRGGTAGRARRFQLELEAEPADQRGAFDWVTGWVGKRVKALVLRFTKKLVAGLATEGIVGRLESQLRFGPVRVDDEDPTRWRAIDDLAAVSVPDAPKVLLLVHGTFSSTLGSFGHLGAGPGLPTLRQWLDRYDLILGQDHPTLSVTPEANAEAILDTLRSTPWSGTAQVDVVCFSRGGMVARWLVERLLPGADLDLQVGKVVCVAATNAGTLLARKANWKRLVDISTNLASAACRVTSVLAPQAALATQALGAVVNGVSVLVKAMTTAALEDGHAPGLQAMNPDEDFVARLNGGEAPRLHPSTRYFAVVSNFEPKLFRPPDRERTGLPPRLVQWAADAFVDGLFQGEPNDLVVHNASTRTLHPAIQDRMMDNGILALQQSKEVYHLNFFLSEHTAPSIGDFVAPWGTGGDVLVGSFTGGPDDESRGQAADQLVDLFVEAKAPQGAEVDRAVMVEVTLQREAFAGAALPGADRATAMAAEATPLIVDIEPRRGLVVEGDQVHVVDVPRPDSPLRLPFVLRAVEALDDPAEVFVNVRQGVDVLAQLELAIEVVDAGEPVMSGVAAVTAAPPVDRGTPATATLMVSHFQGTAGPVLSYTLLAPALGAAPEFPQVQLPADYRGGLEALYVEIEAAWKQHKGDQDLFEARLRSIGEEVAELLFPESMRRHLWSHREALEGMALFTDEPFIPWEIAWIGDDDDGLFLAELAFTRSMRGAFCPDRIRVREDGRFTAVPRYPGRLHLDYALDEERFLHEQLGARSVPVRGPKHAEALRRLLAEGAELDLLHYAGHGEADDREVYLVMGGKQQSGTFVAALLPTGAARPIRLVADDGGRALVFINACKTGRRVAALSGERSWARTFLKKGGAGAFVAPLWSVGDQRACYFSKEFYRALQLGGTFAEATLSARKAARAAGDPSWLSYTVYASPHAVVQFL